jgi:hypothetical protein
MALEWTFYSILNISLKIICICVAGLLEVVYLRKFVQKRTRPRFFILIVITGLLLFPLGWLLDDLFYDTLFSETRYGFATSMILVIVLFIALFFFAYEIYFTRQNQTSKGWVLFCCVYSVVDFIVAVIISQRFLHPNEVPDAFGVFLLIVYTTMLAIAISLLGIRSFQLARKVQDERFRIALLAMGRFMLFIILVFVFEIMDWYMFAFRDYSLLNSLAFGSLLILYYYIYKGFIKPTDLNP